MDPSVTTSTSLTGRVALVTGGRSGLGAATVAYLKAAGATVAIVDKAPTTSEALPEHVDVLNISADVSDELSIESAFAEISARLGLVSILVNCAGVATPGSVLRHGSPMPLDEYRKVIDINLIGTINCIRCVVPHMIQRSTRLIASDSDAGVIINTSSIAAFDGQIGQAAYSASKGAVAGIVLPLARELSDYHIRVMAIAPGLFETPMTLGLPKKSRDIVFSASPEFPKRPGLPREFALLVMSILSNPMLNGEVIRLDGGLRMPAYL